MSGGRYGPRKTPERRCMPIELWPAEDRARWELSITPTSILEDVGGELEHLADMSRSKTAKGWGRFLTYLTLAEPEALTLRAEERATPNRIKAFVRSLEALGNNTATILCRLQEIRDALRVFAPDEDCAFINRIASQVRARHKPARAKRVTVFGDEIANLAYDLMQEASSCDPVEDAIQYRDGLILLLLVHLPLRRKNFTGLSIGESLVFREGQWFVQLTPQQTKTHAWFEAQVDPRLVPWLETYLAIHRPLLLTLTGRWHRPADRELWVSSHGSPMTQIALYDRVTERTRAAFGEAISPHRFRDILASTIASHAPEHIHAAAPLLGHASLRTTEKYYRIARAQEGQRRYVATIESIRSKAHGQNF
jgi:integrase